MHRLTGEWVMDHSCASGTGLMALQTLDWDEQALRAGRRRRRASCRGSCPTTERFGDVVHRRRATGRWPTSASARREPGIAACSIGTSGALRVTVEEAR